MNVLELKYGPLHISVDSEPPITIPLPLEQDDFPMWIPPMHVKITLLSDTTLQVNKDAKDIPAELQRFYLAMETLHIACIPPDRHCNSWWKEANCYYGYFPYETDCFILKVIPTEQHVFVYGDANNLNRVILDILSCFSIVPPLHGAALKKEDKTFIMLGESGGGKTRILKSLLDKGYIYIADEEIFWIDDEIFCCGRVIVEKGGRPNHIPNRHIDANTSYRPTDIFLLTADTENNTPPVLLPVISRQSFWAQMLIGQCDAPQMLKRLSAAIVQYTAIYNKAKRITVDQSLITASVYNIEKILYGIDPQNISLLTKDDLDFARYGDK